MDELRINLRCFECVPTVLVPKITRQWLIFTNELSKAETLDGNFPLRIEKMRMLVVECQLDEYCRLIAYENIA
jgi:hypothetical protein